MERMICSQYLIRLKPTFLCVARAAEHQEPLPCFEQPFTDELFEWLYSYSNKVYIMEREGEIWGFVPSCFSSSTMVLALKFNVEASIALRCLERNRYLDMFEYSPNIKAKKTRSTKISEEQARFDRFFEKINECFFESYTREDDSRTIIRDFEARCLCFSRLVGTPVTVEKDDLTESVKMKGEIDFPLFSAFLLTMFLLAREFAIDRSVRISFRMLSQSVAIVAEISADESDCASALSLWDSMCADMLMPFGSFLSDGGLRIGFQPCRRDLSYLGLKQHTDWLCL